MATFNGLGVAAFAPVSNVTPFTYRDGETFLSELHRIKCYISDMVDILSQADADETTYINTSIATLTDQFNTIVANMNATIANLDPVANVTDLRSRSFASQLGLPAQVYDNFQRSNRDLIYDTGSNGLSYAVMHEPSTSLTTMSIVDGVARRSTVADAASPILMAPVRTPLTVVGAEYAFIGDVNSTIPTGAIIGTCATFFGSGSVQLAVSPTAWQLFNYSGTSQIIQQGEFATPLVADGVTRYQSLMRYDADSSTVYVSLPAGDGSTNNQNMIISDPAVGENWGGNFCCIQDNVNAANDFDSIFFQMMGA